jgi:hypothetical protein
VTERKDARVKYDPATKAAALAALMAGQGVGEVARQYHLPAGTVKSWLSRMRHGPSVAEVATRDRQTIGELLTGYLTETLEALRKQSAIFGDPVWLKQQTAADAAVLHGVMTDKAVRLLEALNGAEPEPRPSV